MHASGRLYEVHTLPMGQHDVPAQRIEHWCIILFLKISDTYVCNLQFSNVERRTGPTPTFHRIDTVAIKQLPVYYTMVLYTTNWSRQSGKAKGHVLRFQKHLGATTPVVQAGSPYHYKQWTLLKCFSIREQLRNVNIEYGAQVLP